MTNPFARFVVYILLPVAFIALAAGINNRISHKDQPVEEISVPRANGVVGHYLQARYAEYRGELDKAVSHYHEALERMPESQALAKRTYGRLILSGHIKEAMDLIRQHDNTIEDKSALSFASMVMALEAVTQQRYDDALARAHAIEQDSTPENDSLNHSIVPVIIAWSNAATGQFTEASKLLRAIDPSHELAAFFQYQLAVMSDYFGDQITARTIYTDIALNNPSYRLAEAALHFFERTNDTENATKLRNAFAKRHPNLELNARDYTSLDIHTLAREGVADLFFEIGGLLLQSYQSEEAMLYLRLAEYLAPNFDVAKLMLARASEQSGHIEMANDIYQSVSVNSPFYYEAQIAVTANKKREEKTGEAIEMMQSLSKTHPDRHEVVLSLGDLYMSEDAYDKARDAYTRVISELENTDTVTGKDWGIYYARGIAHERLGEWAEAESDFIQALTLSPEQPDALNYLGYSWLLMNHNLKDAEEMLKTAIEARPNDAHIIDSYGWALFKLGRYDEAVSYLERANVLMPYDPTVNDHLGDVYWKVGRLTESRYQWQRALDYDPEPGDQALIERKLRYGLDALDSAAHHVDTLEPIN